QVMSDCAAAWGRNDLPSSPCYSELTKCDPVSRNTISLNFSSMVLTGVIPPSIGLLTVLTYLKQPVQQWVPSRLPSQHLQQSISPENS
ncbi:unnamed protein product, partial [Closterium sp. NIES-65]